MVVRTRDDSELDRLLNAGAAEVATGAAYYYFDSKEALVLAYYERDGVVVGVVGGGMPGKVMKARGKIAAATPISEMLG